MKTSSLASGKIKIELKDALTGKIKERIEGNNHVFSDGLLSTWYKNYSFTSWAEAVSNAWLCMNDDGSAIDTEIPYIKGQTIAYGKPSAAANGTFRGAYNATNQVLDEINTDHHRWLFQYDFTTSQGNGGTIRNIGLTHQYLIGQYKRHQSLWLYPTEPQAIRGMCDGRYIYAVTEAGILTKTDLWTLLNQTINLSAIIGNTNYEYKHVGFCPANGKYYIYRYSGTSANRKVFVFSDNTFSTLESEYAASNLSISTSTISGFYVYGNNLYFLNAQTNTNIIQKYDFVNNTAPVNITISSYNNAAYTENTYCQNGVLGQSMTWVKGNMFSAQGEINYYKGIIFDMATESVIAYTSSMRPTSNPRGRFLEPMATEKVLSMPHQFGNSWYSYGVFNNAAISSYILPAPVTKTDAQTMTVTYELKVYW